MSDWIEWHGGERPINGDVQVQVQLRTTRIEGPSQARWWRWRHDGNSGDIIAYRIVSQDSELDRLRKENAALRDLLALCLAHGSFPQGSGILHAIRAALQGAKDD